MTACSPSSLDAIDRAFIHRADHARHRDGIPSEPPAIPPAARRVPDRVMPAPPPPRPPVGAPTPLLHEAASPTTVGPVRAAGIVARLLDAVPEHWARLADRVEEAHAANADVIAVAGCRRGEGRSTVVACLHTVLVTRGRQVDVHATVPLELPQPQRSPRSRGCIVLIDAGVWFPGGPIRRGWLERQSLGCHAVILVRRHDVATCAARATALEAMGLRVLGEVVTMTVPTPLPAGAP
jgi:hypothetical protein